MTQFATAGMVFPGAINPQAGVYRDEQASAELQAVGEGECFEVGAIDLLAGDVEVVGKGGEVLGGNP